MSLADPKTTAAIALAVLLKGKTMHLNEKTKSEIDFPI